MGFFQKIFGGGQAQGGKLGELLQTLITDLNLDSSQSAKFSETFQAFRAQRKEIKSAGGDRSQIQQARAQMTTQLMSFLSEEQKQKFAANAAKYDSLLHQE